MSTVLRIGKRGKGESASPIEPVSRVDLDTRIELIQALIPLGLEAVEDVLQQEVRALAGLRYARDGAPHLVRWGRRGSVYVADQKLPLLVPLQSYQRFQEPRAAAEGALRRLLYGLNCRDYRAAAEAVPEAFGLSRSRVSRRYMRATARQLQVLQERWLEQYDFVSLMLDGKTFADDTMVIALGITLRGEKVLLGFVQTGNENATACAAFLRGLVDRGLRIAEGLLVGLDGSMGLRRAVRDVFGDLAQVQRCTWHKRENVVAYLPKHLQPLWRAKLQRACRQPTYTAAQAELQRLHQDLRRLNEDAARSLAEGLEETLTLHRLGLADRLGQSLLTTNGIESILALVEQRVGKVDHWTSSDQKQRWLATALLELEPRLRRLRGYRALLQLRAALKQSITEAKEVMVA